MTWREDVSVIRDHGYRLKRNDHSCAIPKNEEFLVRAMEMGITNDMELVDIIMKKKKEDIARAEILLASFAVKYENYI